MGLLCRLLFLQKNDLYALLKWLALLETFLWSKNRIRRKFHSAFKWPEYDVDTEMYRSKKKVSFWDNLTGASRNILKSQKVHYLRSNSSGKTDVFQSRFNKRLRSHCLSYRLNVVVQLLRWLVPSLLFKSLLFLTLLSCCFLIGFYLLLFVMNLESVVDFTSRPRCDQGATSSRRAAREREQKQRHLAITTSQCDEYTVLNLCPFIHLCR